MEQDRACDAVALRAGFPSTDYARHLVEVARCVRARTAVPAALTFGRRSDLRERIGLLLERTEAGGTGGGRVRRVVTVAASSALVALTSGVLAATNLWICTAAAAG